uniref:Ion transport domain-containing protein n=1 Tax=Acrobeloides nanus TaxID=290746 RepID=A0A914DWW3_9BILA
MLWFTFEYLARFIATPIKCSFVKQPLNIIDLLTIIPFFVEECMPFFGFGVELRNLRGAMVVIRVMRLARVARIFKLARYSIGLRAFGETMRKSAAELSMLGMFLLTGIMLFSTAIYFFERDEPNSKFYSIPAACWWCIITMTTVGYGDLVPVTTGGKVVASMASVCGIIVLAFPISMIIDKFAESTGEWFGDEFVLKHQKAKDQGGRFKSMRKSRRGVI